MKFRITHWLILAISLALLTACTTDSDDATASLSPEQTAWRLIDDGALLIDVRSRQEFEQGHLQDAVNIPHTEIDKLAKMVKEHKGKQAVLYCGSGRRAELVRKELEKKGYKNVHNGLGYEGLKKVKKGS